MGRREQAWQRFFEAAVGTGAGPVFRLAGAMSGGGESGGSLPQRLLRAGFRDPVRNDSAAHCAHPGEELSAGGAEAFQRRAEEVSLLIREAFLRGISTRQVGRVVATITGETVSAQTVSKLTRDLDEAVRQFHQARLSDDYAYLFLDGVSLRVRRPTGRKQVQMLVAYGIRRDGTRHLLAFLRSQGEEPGRLGRPAAGSLPARTGGPSAGADSHRRLSPVWRRRFAPSIRGCGISAAGCTRCATFWRKCGSATTTK